MNNINVNKRDEMNSITSIFIDFATSRTLTIEEAIGWLKDESYLRTVRETIRRYSGLEDMDDATLKTTLIDMLMEGKPPVKRDSIRKNLANWFMPDQYAINRESALQLALALELAPNDAEEMMVRLCGEGFHLRDPKDIVQIYCLNNGLKYFQYNALLTRMREKGLVPEEKKEESEEKKKASKGKKKASKAEKDEAKGGQGGDASQLDEQVTLKQIAANVAKAKQEMTSMVAKEVGQLQTEEELEAFLADNKDKLGEMHNTAYTLFIEYMNLLRQPGSQGGENADGEGGDAENSSAMSVEEILKTYMFNKYIPKGKIESQDIAQDALQNAIQSFWPDSSTLSKMRNRKVDVTRKVMILLFLACDGGESTYGDQSLESLDDAFQDMYIRLDTMLIDCGYAPLDARSPFDWIVLYCMCSDDSLIIDEKMQRFLKSIFLFTEGERGEEADGGDADMD